MNVEFFLFFSYKGFVSHSSTTRKCFITSDWLPWRVFIANEEDLYEK